MATTNADLATFRLTDGVNEVILQIKDALARNDIEQLKALIAGGIHYIGKTTTELKDGSTVTEIALVNDDTSETSTVTVQVGNLVDYNGVMFAFNQSKQWDQLGSSAPLGTLAYKDSVSATYTPVGTVGKPTFTGNKMTSTGTVTPSGTVSAPAFTGIEKEVSVSGTPSGDVAVSASTVPAGDKPTYTPEGSVSVSPITQAIQQITDVGTLPSLSWSVANDTLTINWSAGQLPTASEVDVATGIKSAAFNGTGAKLSAEFTGKEMSSKGKYTPSGNVAAPKFTGDTNSVSVSGTPSGDVSAPIFSGSPDTIVSK